MIFNSAPHHCHSQSGAAAPHDLFSVKRLEYTLFILEADADSGIRYFQHDVVALLNFIITRDWFVKVSVVGGNADFAAIRHRLGGI